MTMLARLRSPTATQLAILAAALCTLPQTGCSKNAPDADGWITLFDGKTLDGWTDRSKSDGTSLGAWSVKEGSIVGRQSSSRDESHYEFLVSDVAFKNYELEFEVKADWETASGVAVRLDDQGRCLRVTIDHCERGIIGHLGNVGLGGFDTRTFWIRPVARLAPTEQLEAVNILEEINAETRELLMEARSKVEEKLQKEESRAKDYLASIQPESRPDGAGAMVAETQLRLLVAQLQSKEQGEFELNAMIDMIEQGLKEGKSPSAILSALQESSRRSIRELADLRSQESQKEILPLLAEYWELSNALGSAHHDVVSLERKIRDKLQPVSAKQMPEHELVPATSDDAAASVARSLEALRLERDVVQTVKAKLISSIDKLKLQVDHNRAFFIEYQGLRTECDKTRELLNAIYEKTNEASLREMEKEPVEALKNYYSCPPEAFLRAWNPKDWNKMRIRVEGSPPKISTWISDEKILAWDGATFHRGEYDAGRIVQNLGDEGKIALVIEPRLPWAFNAVCRWRNIRVRELK